MNNDGKAFFESLNAVQCAPPPPTVADWLQFILAITAAVIIAEELRTFFSWLFPAIRDAAARRFNHQFQRSKPL